MFGRLQIEDEISIFSEFFSYFTRWLNTIFARLCKRKESIIFRACVFFEAGTVVWKTVWVGHLRQEILLRKTEIFLVNFEI